MKKTLIFTAICLLFSTGIVFANCKINKNNLCNQACQNFSHGKGKVIKKSNQAITCSCDDNQTINIDNSTTVVISPTIK